MATIHLTKGGFENRVAKIDEMANGWRFLGERPALIDFYASWCGPCRRLIPVLKEIYATHNPTGKLQIVGISVDREIEKWHQALEEEQMPWIQLHDTHEAPYNPCDIYGISAIPTTLLIDRNGVIVARNASEEELIEILSK